MTNTLFWSALARSSPGSATPLFDHLIGRGASERGGLSAQTRRHIHRVLHSALSRAVEQQLLARNPAEAFKKRLPRVEPIKMKTLTVDQSARLLAPIKHTRIYWPVLLALSTGMRRGEVFALRWKNVDLERGHLSVMESLEQTKDGIRFKSPKTDRTRVVTLPAFAIGELRRLKKQQAEELKPLECAKRQTHWSAPEQTDCRCSRRA